MVDEHRQQRVGDAHHGATDKAEPFGRGRADAQRRRAVQRVRVERLGPTQHGIAAVDRPGGQAGQAADGRTLARALRVAGRVEPVFVDDIAAMPQAILKNALGGDVVLCMGAGTIGAVPGKIIELLQKEEQTINMGERL